MYRYILIETTTERSETNDLQENLSNHLDELPQNS